MKIKMKMRKGSLVASKHNTCTWGLFLFAPLLSTGTALRSGNAIRPVVLAKILAYIEFYVGNLTTEDQAMVWLRVFGYIHVSTMGAPRSVIALS